MLPPRPDSRLEPAVAGTVRQALVEQSGDILVFLPGQAEIRRTAELLQPDEAGWSLHPLYGNLPQAAQDAAIRAAPAGTRKVVLATSIAETSLTIEGVRVVVDAGLARVPKFSPGSGMTRLVTVRVSRASADQRRGRAGRTAPGICYRLWAAQEDHHLLPRSTPEILEADLAPLALELAVHGIRDPGSLDWLDPPPAAALAEARALLRQLEALDATGAATPHGRRMAELGTHPRLAHLLLRGTELGAGPAAAQLAAMLEERDMLRGVSGPPDPDVQLRLELLGAGPPPPEFHGWAVDRSTVQRVRDESRAWRESLQRRADPSHPGRAKALPRGARSPGGRRERSRGLVASRRAVTPRQAHFWPLPTQTGSASAGQVRQVGFCFATDRERQPIRPRWPGRPTSWPRNSTAIGAKAGSGLVRR